MTILIAPGGPVMTNAYVVADDDGAAFIIDVGYDPARLMPEIERRGWRIEAIVATHGHFDHIAGHAEATALWSAPLWMHPETVPVACSAAEHAKWFGMECDDSPPPDHTFVAGDTFTVGTMDFTIRHCPGHCPGSAVLVAEGHAFVGDVLFAGGVGRWDLPGADHQVLMRSIREQLMSLPDDTVVYPGHGETTTIGHERRHNPFRFDWEHA